MLPQKDIEFYRDNGYLLVEDAVTPEQLARLRAEGCDLAQGFLFGRPVPASQIPAVITELGAPRFAPAREPA